MKKILSFLFVLALASGGYYWRFHSASALVQQVSFSHYNTLTEAKLSPSQYKNMLEIYHGCFEEAREIGLQKYLESQSPHDSPWEKAAIEKRVNQLLQDIRVDSTRSFKDRTNMYVGFLQNQVVGFFSCADDNVLTDNGVMIWSVCVDEKLRKKGIGSKLIQHAISSCQKEGRPLSLVVDTYRKNLISMYQHFGFVEMTPDHPFPEKSFDYFDKVYMRYLPGTPSPTQK